jgi:hypothetical protein
MANDFRIVNLGDSIHWGQGLLEAQKYDVLVKTALAGKYPGVTLERFAHSGAVIGGGTVVGNPAPGEVPASRPTIIEQCDNFANSPGSVDLVLVNGGINDVGVATILNPLALVPSLHSRIVAACHDSMLKLLNRVKAKFIKPTCQILVTGYYTILSDQSDPVQVPKMLSLHGIAVPPFVKPATWFDPIFDRCENFFSESTAQLQSAIKDAQDARIQFVASGFTEANAVFVPNTSMLWGLDDDLNPLDPAAPQRHPQCNIAFPQPIDFLHREQCYRASAGHPNIPGAVQYSKQILGAL